MRVQCTLTFQVAFLPAYTLLTQNLAGETLYAGSATGRTKRTATRRGSLIAGRARRSKGVTSALRLCNAGISLATTVLPSPVMRQRAGATLGGASTRRNICTAGRDRSAWAESVHVPVLPARLQVST